MAKKKSGGSGANVDFKELAIRYGDRVGLAVAAVLALLFVFWGFSSVASNPLTKTDVKRVRDQAAAHLRSFPVEPKQLEPANSNPEVKTVDAIAKLSESKKKEIPVGTLSTRYPFVWQPPRPDVARSRPEVFTVVKMVGRPWDGAYRINDVTDDRVHIAASRDNIKLERDKKDDGNRGRLGPGAPGAGGGLGGGPGKPGAKGPSEGPSSGMSTGTKRWFGRWIQRSELNDEHILAVNIWPVRASVIAGMFPYAKQIDELASKLKMDRNEVARESYFSDLKVQRRELVVKGTRMADGTILQEDMVVVPNPEQPGQTMLKPYAEVQQDPTRPDEMRAAGWIDLDVNEQVKMTRWATEWYTEPDGTVRSLRLLSGRLTRKIPKPLRDNYPSLVADLPEMKELVEKLKRENTPLVPPKRDPRLEKDDDNQFEEDISGQPGQSGAGGSSSMSLGAPPPTQDSGKSGDKTKTSPDGKVEATQQISGIPEFCLVRFLDLTLNDERVPVGGRTFEYRFQVVMGNPNFERRDVAVPEFAKDKELFSPWSPTCRVSFERPNYLYADERVRDPKRGNAPDLDTDKVPVQVHKWIGFFDPSAEDTRDQERMGEWWIDRILAARGEFIGRVPTDKKQGAAKLIFWSAFTPEEDDPKRMGSELMEEFRSPSLLTRALLVDFEGGSKLQRQRRLTGRPEDEDVPAELLVLEPDGRLFARSLLRDREDEVRQKRFDRWLAWFKTIEEKMNRKPEEKKQQEDQGSQMQRPGR